MRTFAIALLLAACSGGSSTTPAPQPGTTQPAPTDPQPTETAPPTPGVMTPEDCTAKGGKVKGDIGDGKVACGEGERELGKVKTGIEGGVCCAAPTP